MENGFQERGGKDWKERERNGENDERWKLLNLKIPVFHTFLPFLLIHFITSFINWKLGCFCSPSPSKHKLDHIYPAHHTQMCPIQDRILFPSSPSYRKKTLVPECVSTVTLNVMFEKWECLSIQSQQKKCGEREREREPSFVLLITSFQHVLCVNLICV